MTSRAEWHHRRREFGAGAQHLAAVRDPSPVLAARAAALRAMLESSIGPHAGTALGQAAQVLLDAGDRLGHLTCLCWLGTWHGQYGDARQGFTILDQAVRQLRAVGDQQALALAERLFAAQARRYSRKQGWQLLRSAIQGAHACSTG